MNWRIENVVASTKLADSFDLDRIAAEFEDAEYNRKKFPGLVYRVKNPKAAFLVFTSGKVVCMGTKSVEGIRDALHRIQKDFREHGIPTYENFDISIHNIVIAGDYHQKVNLESLYERLDAEYEPELFPGLVYRCDRFSMILFSNGRFVVSCKDPGRVDEFLKSVVEG